MEAYIKHGWEILIFNGNFLNSPSFSVMLAPIFSLFLLAQIKANQDFFEVVKHIYQEYLEGASMLKIARGLMADGVLNGTGNEKWHTSNLNQILRYEKYIRDALLQKTYTKDFLTKQRVKKNEYVPQYYIEDNHDAIIPREVFMQVQEEMIRRRCDHSGQSGKKRSFSSNHCFSQIIICSNCGEIFRRVHWNNRGIKEYDEKLVRRLIDKVKVHEDRFEVVLRSGVMVEVEG